MRGRHLPLLQDLGARISSGDLRPGDLLPPEPELARRFGVSRFTVRRALDALAAEGRVSRRRGEGTRVLATPEPAAAIVSYLGETDTHVHADLFLALARACQASGMSLQVVDRPQAYRPVLRRDGLDIPNHLVCAGHPAGLAADLPTDPRAVRAVTGLRHDHGGGFDYAVLADRRDGLAQAVAGLRARGHRRIALVGSPGAERDGGATGLYHAALAEQGCDWRRPLVCNGPEAGWAAQIAAGLAAPERPTAVLCDMDFLALHVWDATRACALSIPDDLAVVGMYDTPWSQTLRPQLATVAFPVDLLARTTVACLAAGRPPTMRRIGVMGTLVERASLAPPRTEA